MIRDDEHWLELTDAFHAAAIDGKRWYEALSAFAGATGSQHGQLMCIGEGGSMPLNMLTNVDPSLPNAFLEAGGADPRINPRRRAGIAQPPLTVLAESDFITPDEYRQDTHYQEFAVPWDVPYICLTTLERRRELLVGLAVIRSRRQGHIDAQGRRAFTTIAPHVRAAVRTNLALAEHADGLLADSLEALTMPAFICDQRGVVRRLTPAAETLVSAARGLQLKTGRLTAQDAVDAAALSDAVAAMAAERRPGAAAHQVVVIRALGADSPPLVLDVIPLPGRRLTFSFDARVLVLVRGHGAAGAQRRAAILQTVYGATAAETEIALQLFAGKTPEAIAVDRGVSIGTVRVQIKALLAKAGVARQVELVARLGQL
jgi:DNA-binding CsgD family transcriptional regulator